MARRTLPIVWLVAMLLAAAPSYPAQGDAGGRTLPPARPGLHTVPLPLMDGVEEAVSEQIREALRSFAELTSAERASDIEVGEAYGTLARLFHAYELFDSAEPAYLNASRLAQDDARWPHLLGYLYEQTGRFDQAVDFYRAALRVQSDDRSLVAHLANVYLRLNRLSEAREQFERIAAVFPAVASNGLGEVALREGRFDEAVGHFHAALERAPQATAIHYSLAMAYRGLGRLPEARSQLQQRGAGELRAADAIVDGLQALVRGERVRVIQGKRAYEAGQFNDAAEAFGRAVEAAPSSLAARVNLGMALAQLGEVDAAMQQLQTALRLDADNVPAHASLGMMLARLGRDREAVEHLQAASRSEPGNAAVTGELIRTLLRLGRDDEAVAALSGAGSFEVDDEGALLQLSILLSNRERYGDAIALLELAHRQYPDRPRTATTLARLLAAAPDLSVRDGRRALALAMDVWDEEPSPPHAETIALGLAELGRCREAASWMRRAIGLAEQDSSESEAVRLRNEAARYGGDSCRP